VAHYLFHLTKKRAAEGKNLGEQAADLLRLKMWGIGVNAPNRRRLAPGDRVLIYVGAPEHEFIGSAELRSAARDWTPREAAKFPGDFEGGVLLRRAEVWSHAVPLKSVLPQLALKETNPGARFSGVVRLTDEDYRTIVAFGADEAPLPQSTEDRAAARPSASTPAAATTPVTTGDVAATALGLPVGPRLAQVVTDVLRALVVLLLAVLMAAAIFWLYFFVKAGP
jgi:hypothetical protein